MIQQLFRSDNLFLFLAIARYHTLTKAAAHLHIDHSTVSRRLKKMQSEFNATLFTHNQQGYFLTSFGLELFTTAERIEEEMLKLEHRITGRDARLTGSIRVTTSDCLATGYLASHFANFLKKYPDIKLEVSVDNQITSLARREADIAIRAHAPPHGNLVGKKVSNFAHGFYCSTDYIDRHGLPESYKGLSSHTLCGYDESLGFYDAARWINQYAKKARISATFNTTQAMAKAARHGIGIAILPCFVGDQEPLLQKLFKPDDSLKTELWLLTHPDIHESIRIQTFMRFFSKVIEKDNALLSGST